MHIYTQFITTEETWFELHFWVHTQRIKKLWYYTHPTRVETRLYLLTVDGKLVIKYPSGKTSYWIRAESAQDLSWFNTVGNISSTATPVASPLTCDTPNIYLKESNVNNNHSLEERNSLLNTEVIAMQSFKVDQVLIQPLKNSTLEKSPSDISFEVKRSKEVTDIICQQN